MHHQPTYNIRNVKGRRKCYQKAIWITQWDEKHWKWQICGVLLGFFSCFKTIFKSYLLYNRTTNRHLLSKKKNIYPPKDLYLNVHSSFFIFATINNWKKFKYPSAGKLINKLWYVNTLKYYSERKKNYWYPQKCKWILNNYTKWKSHA